jgi:hypothetical protein
MSRCEEITGNYVVNNVRGSQTKCGWISCKLIYHVHKLKGRTNEWVEENELEYYNLVFSILISLKFHHVKVIENHFPYYKRLYSIHSKVMWHQIACRICYVDWRWRFNLMDERPQRMMTCRKCPKNLWLMIMWNIIKLINSLVFFVLNYVHCLLQVISFCMLLFNKEFATIDCWCYFMDSLVYTSWGRSFAFGCVLFVKWELRCGGYQDVVRKI